MYKSRYLLNHSPTEGHWILENIGIQWAINCCEVNEVGCDSEREQSWFGVGGAETVFIIDCIGWYWSTLIFQIFQVNIDMSFAVLISSCPINPVIILLT